MYRSVELLPGQHSVIWEYRPASQRLGFVISGFSSAVMIAIGIVHARRSGGKEPKA
jgi:hypothetical protein